MYLSFYYDAIKHPSGFSQGMPIRSLVGLIPLYAVSTLEPELISKFPSFKKRVDWFIENRSDMSERNLASMKKRGRGDRMLLSFVSKDRLKKILSKMLDEDEFLSGFGIRSLSRYHKEHPYEMWVNGEKYTVAYVPGDSDSGLFGGNSNWRGVSWILYPYSVLDLANPG